MLKVIFQTAPARVYTRNFEVKKYENLYAKYCDLCSCNTGVLPARYANVSVIACCVYKTPDLIFLIS